jgi:glycosyltransferase involved in cell wall biosynthesis
VNKFKFKQLGHGYVCLAKVEPRKGQYELANLLPEDFPITFIGEVVDERISTLDPMRRRKFVGAWDRDEVESKLTEFSALVLMSEAEADALVLYEAQAAGLGVIARTQALGAQDVSLRWIKVLPDGKEDIGTYLERERIHIAAYRKSVRAHALGNYSYQKNAQAWDEMIRELLDAER